MADARLSPLIADYVRDVDGSYDVLGDALLERGLVPLPGAGDPAERLEAVFARLPAADQVRIGSAGVRRLAPHMNEARLRALVIAALDAVDAEPSAAAPDALRNRLFGAWKPASGVDRRVVWAAWMVLRGSPATALRTARGVRAAELDAQIVLVADAFAVDLA